MTINEVAPPGFGHTKGDKEKGVKKGGTAAAFDKARKEGRFKGSKSDMFAIMWSQKNKGDKPHYKPGTDKKYKKYQDEGVTYGYKGKKYKKLPDHVKTPSGWGKDARSDLGKAKDAVTDALGKTNTKKTGVLANEAVKGQDTESRKEGAKERATEKRAHAAWKPGTKKRPLYSTTRHTKGDAESYATQQKQSIKWHDKRTKGKFIPGTTTEETSMRKKRDVTKSKPKAPQFNAAKELVTDAPYMKLSLIHI